MRNLSPIVVCSLIVSLLVGSVAYWFLPDGRILEHEAIIKLVMSSCLAGLAFMATHAILYVFAFEGANQCKETFNSPFTSQWRIDHVKDLVRGGHTLEPLTAVNLLRWLRRSHIKYVLG